MVTIENEIYVVIIPEQSIRQDFDPDTRLPFVTEAEAQAWQDATLAAIVQHQAVAQAAAEAAEQARLAASIHLEIAADQTAVAAGTPINVTATMKNGLGQTVPLDASFAVPIESDAGLVEMIKGVAFVAGEASVTISFPRSGYFRITEAGINRKLPPEQYLRLPAPFEVTVFE